jgi:hypothetical protein
MGERWQLHEVIPATALGGAKVLIRRDGETFFRVLPIESLVGPEFTVEGDVEEVVAEIFATLR